MAKKKAARKRKKVTKHKPNPVPEIEVGEYCVTTEQLEEAKAQARQDGLAEGRKEGFKNGWEAAKLDGVETNILASKGLERGVATALQPKTAQLVLPLIQARLKELRGDKQAQGGHWIMSTMLDLDPFNAKRAE